MNIENIKWHHRVAHFPEVQFDCIVTKATDFCSYWRLFCLKAFLVIPIACVLIGSFLGWYISSLAAFITPSISMTAQFSTFIWVVIHSVVGIAIICEYLQGKFRAWRYRKKQAKIELESHDDYVPPEDGFLKLKYKSFKGKYCPKMEY